MTLYTETGSLPVTAPFDFARSLRFIEEFPPVRDEQEITANLLTKAISIDGQCVAFRVHGGGTVEQPEMMYTLFSMQPLPESIKSECCLI